MVRFKMYNMHFFQLILLLIFDSVNGNMECDCNTIAAVQEVMQKELFQIKVENSKMASRLRRLEASSKNSKTMNHQHSETVSDMTKDQNPSHDNTRNDIKRIETIESTLARIVPQFESYIHNKTNDIKHRIHGQRMDKIESELALVSKKTDNLLDMNDDSENAMVQLHRTIKKAFHGEKIKGLNFELKINEKVKNIEEYCVNFTITSGQLIDEFKKEVAIENKEFAAEMNKQGIDINNTITDHKMSMDSSLDDLENEFSKTKKTLLNLEDIISKDRTDGGWSIWGSFGSCSDTCGRGVMIRSRTCTHPKPSLKGKDCEGSPVEIAFCNRNTCPDTRVYFTAYGVTGGDIAVFPKIIQNYEECIISKEKVREFIKRCCGAVGIEDDHGTMLADVLVAADYRGHYSHGLKNLDKYLSDVTNRFVATKGVPRVVKQTQATALVDGDNLLGPVVGNYCMDLAIEKAKQSGIGWVSASGSNHFGMAGWYGLRAVDKGFIGMAFTNTGAGMAPTRAIQNALGTNPICIAAPAKDGDSFVLDMATTTVAFGKVILADMKGEAIPKGWAVDKDGNDTVECSKMYGIHPLGGRENTSGYKGYGLAVMVEMFCSMLRGSLCGYNMEVGVHDVDCVSHCFVAIDPGAFEDGFHDRLSDMMTFCRNLDPVDGETEVLLPGDPERKHMELCDRREGILYHPNQIIACTEIATRLHVEPLT